MCCKEVGKEEEIHLENRSEGQVPLVSVAQATGDNDQRQSPLSLPSFEQPPSVSATYNPVNAQDDRGVANPSSIPVVTTVDTGFIPPEANAVDTGKSSVDSSRGQPTQNANLPPNPLAGLIPRGEYVRTSSDGNGDVDALELANMERLVAKMAGSPLGCLDFENTFRTRQLAGQIVVLKDHELDGATFGEVCGQYTKVTILGLQNAAGKVIWAPAPYIRLHSSDQIMLMECTPFALAMGLCQEGSLAASSLSPRSLPVTPGTNREKNIHDFHNSQYAQDKEKRRCCV